MIYQKSNKVFHKIYKLTLIFIILFFYFITSSYAVDVSFQWNKNTDRDIAGYRVFCREEGRSYDYNTPSWEGTGPSCTIYNLDDTKSYLN
jgi:hypothetical protein